MWDQGEERLLRMAGPDQTFGCLEGDRMYKPRHRRPMEGVRKGEPGAVGGRAFRVGLVPLRGPGRTDLRGPCPASPPGRKWPRPRPPSPRPPADGGRVSLPGSRRCALAAATQCAATAKFIEIWSARSARRDMPPGSSVPACRNSGRAPLRDTVSRGTRGVSVGGRDGVRRFAFERRRSVGLRVQRRGGCEEFLVSCSVPRLRETGEGAWGPWGGPRRSVGCSRGWLWYASAMPR